jgi:DNA-binding MarR family transcriptional regulator
MDSSYFFHIKPVRALIALSNQNRDWYASLLAKEADCTYAHMIKILDSFEENNLVVFSRTGRIKLVRLTDFGIELAHEFENIVRRLERFNGVKKTVGESLVNDLNL